MKVFLPVCFLLLLVACSEPVQTEPLLTGQLEVGLELCPVDEPCSFTIGTLNLQTRGLGNARYSFSGTLSANSETFGLEGEDASGTITGTLTDQNSGVYTLLGTVDYSQPEPSGQLAALCEDGPCVYSSINIGVPEQAIP